MGTDVKDGQAGPQLPDTVAVDVGGTKIAAALVRDGAVVTRGRQPTQARHPERIPEQIAGLVAEVAAGGRVHAVGVSAAGFLDAERTRVRFAPNIAWRDEPLRDRLTALLGVPVVLENDANAAAWGEFVAGAGRAVDDLLMVTVGTGIGGGIITGGRLLTGAFGMGAEIGHLRVVPDGLPCGCGRRGCWEAHGSGAALSREARELAATGPGAAVLARAGGAVEQVRGEHLTESAAAGDPAARGLLHRFGTEFGQNLASVAAVLDPGLIVIGGGAAQAGDLLLDPVREGFALGLLASGHRPRPQIVAAALGTDAGLIGAADLAVRAVSR